jgi:hypothetical protein
LVSNNALSNVLPFFTIEEGVRHFSRLSKKALDFWENRCNECEHTKSSIYFIIVGKKEAEQKRKYAV